MEKRGYIKLHRKTLENPVVCKDADYFAVWCYLLLNATHDNYDVVFKGKRMTLKPGQLITSRKSISDKFSIHESKVERILKKLKIEQQIEQQSGNKNRLIKVLNWEMYQHSEQQNEHQSNINRTSIEHQSNTNKNVKNDKHVKNDKEVAVIPTVAASLFTFFEQNIGTLSPHTISMLEDYTELMCEEAVLYAIEQAVEKNVKTHSYIQAICKGLLAKEVKTPADLLSYKEQWKKEKPKNSANYLKNDSALSKQTNAAVNAFYN